MNTVLIGMRCSGKSSIAKMLGKKLKLDVVDTDKLIEKKLKMDIPEIIKKKGWDFFREKEKEVVMEVSKLENSIISTGGGTMADPENRKALKENGKVIYLYITPETSIQRQMDEKNRPKLTTLESIEDEVNQIYLKRNGEYCQSSDIIIERSEDLKKDCEEIISKLTQYDYE